MLELKAAKDEVSSLYSQASKDEEAIEEDYQKALELIFAYGYGCYVFKHNICGEQLEVLDGMPDSSDPLPLDFFANLECPLTLAATEVTTVEVDQSEATKEPEKVLLVETRADFCLPFSSLSLPPPPPPPPFFCNRPV